MREGDLTHHLLTPPHCGHACGQRSGEPLPGEDRGAKKEQDGWLTSMEEDVDQQEIDEELQGGVEEPPDIAEEGVCPLVSDLGDGEIPDEAAALNERCHGFEDGADAAAARPADGQIRAVGRHERARIAPVPPILPLTRPRLKEDR